MEDMATGEIRLSILWEWLHKGGSLTEDDAETGARVGDLFDAALFRRLLAEEYDKLRRASDRDVHDDSKGTTLPVAREIAETYVLDQVKTPWYIDLLNINLNNHDLALAKERIQLYMTALKDDGRLAALGACPPPWRCYGATKSPMARTQSEVRPRCIVWTSAISLPLSISL